MDDYRGKTITRITTTGPTKLCQGGCGRFVSIDEQRRPYVHVKHYGKPDICPGSEVMALHVTTALDELRAVLEEIAEKAESWHGKASDVPFWNLGDIARAALKRTAVVTAVAEPDSLRQAVVAVELDYIIYAIEGRDRVEMLNALERVRVVLDGFKHLAA